MPDEIPEQFHKATYRMGADLDLSPFSGGEDLLFAHRCVERIEGWFISKSSLANSCSAPARFWRLSELVFAWLPLNYLAAVVQHEVFGHGYRIRDVSPAASVTGYGFDAPPPYGDGGAFTRYETTSKFTTTKEASVAMGGVEATAILALLTKYKWLEAQMLDPRQAVLYLLGEYDLPLYIGTIKAVSKQGRAIAQGHDLIGYVQAVNLTYTDGRLHTSTLRSVSWINLADPFTYYSVFAWFYYIYSGKETSIPMIPLGICRYLPSVRLGLTPFGPEYFLENFLMWQKKPLYFYFKAGWNGGNTYVGTGFYADKLCTWNRFSFGARVDLWRQPKLLLHQGNIPFLQIDFKDKPNHQNPLYPLSQQHAMHLGVGLSAIFSWRLSPQSGLETELGYKTSGFVPGESLFAFPIVRAYYSLLF